MTALLFTLTLFTYWGLVGYATLILFPARLRPIQGALLAPAVGIAMVILPVFFLSRLGFAVKEFATYLLPALGGLSLLIIAIKRPVFPLRRLGWFIAILLAALLLAARPMLSYGFDWVSLGNDDMANYSLAAQRFLEHGFSEKPELSAVFAGRDYSQTYWFMHAAGGVRSGSELMLAAVWAISGLNAHQIFMPVIMALHLALICGAAALVAGFANNRRTPLMAAALMALSPMTTLGALYQLIGQVGGLALLCAAVTLMYRTRSLNPPVRLLLGSIPAVSVLGALFVWYPEVLPFLGLGWFLYLGLRLRRGIGSALQVLIPALIVGLLILVVLNKYVGTALLFMLGQTSGGMHSADLSAVLFPYFLVPSGIAALWGLLPIFRNFREPFVSLAIAGGLLLSCWFIRRLARQAWAASVPAMIATVMLVVGLLLFYRNNDFGLFKLAMFFQPFMIGVVAIDLGKVGWKSISLLQRLILATILTCCIISQVGYVTISTGEGSGGLNDVSHASAQKVNQQFKSLLDSIESGNVNRVLVSETPHVVFAKFQALYSNGRELLFPSRDFFHNILNSGVSAQEESKKGNQYVTQTLDGNSFLKINSILLEHRKSVFLVSNIKSDIFNGYYSVRSDPNYFRTLENPNNRLMFIHSELGNHYYLGYRNKISFFQLENDPMFPGREFSGLGRHLLLRALGPTPHPRIVMELTATIVKQFDSNLPKPDVQGISLGFVGRGTGRVVSRPIDLARIDGVPYLAIDMGRDGRQFTNPRRGLMLLYGREVPLDYRRLTTFGRDISLISEEDYQSFKAPASLQKFPADLANKHLEYSGIYEDGWISERSFFELAPKPDTRYLAIKGMVPQIDAPDFHNTLTVSIDGRNVVKQPLGLGAFEVKVPVSVNGQRHRIDLAFDRYQILPGSDGRPTSGKIAFIGFTKD